MAFEDLDLAIADTTSNPQMAGTAAATICISISQCNFSRSNCAQCSAINC